MKNRTKKFEIIALAAMLAFSLVFLSCGDSGDPSSPGGGGGDPTSLGGGDPLPWDGSVDTGWFDDGEPFKISTPEQLAGLAELVNAGNGFAGKTITQTANFNLGGKEWTPIGTAVSGNTFNGAYDGNGKTISGLKISSTGNNQGMFGYIDSSGKVTGVKLLGVSISGGNMVGAVAGLNLGEVARCSVTGSVTGTGTGAGGIVGDNNGIVEECTFDGSVKGGNAVGGVAGANAGGSSAIRNCSVKGSVEGSGDNVGGIVGLNYAGMTGCTSSGSVKGAKYVGGVAGANNSTVANCSFSGSSVTGTGYYVGGVAGYNDGVNAKVQNCSSKGAVTGSSYTGGVVGYNDQGAVSNCSASGEVNGAGFVGGVVGYNMTNSTVQNCIFSGASVTARLVNNSVGGLVGYNSSGCTVQNCVALNTSISGSGIFLGRVAGQSDGTLTNNYGRNPMTVGSGTVTSGAAGDKNGANVTDATAKTTDFWTTAGNWSGGAWSSSVWTFTEGSYPVLQ